MRRIMMALAAISMLGAGGAHAQKFYGRQSLHGLRKPASTPSVVCGDLKVNTWGDAWDKDLIGSFPLSQARQKCQERATALGVAGNCMYDGNYSLSLGRTYFVPGGVPTKPSNNGAVLYAAACMLQ